MRFPKHRFQPLTGLTLPDLAAVVLLLATFVGALVLASHWFDPLQTQKRELDLSLLTLPRATFLSFGRILIAYFISLFFAITIGYWAAHSRAAERWIIPLVDILQSIPVLGFLPGTVLILISIFPSTSIGLELAAILMIVTSMLWNMLLGFYASIKNIPQPYSDVIRAYGYSKIGTLLRLEVPFAVNSLAWNSMLSVAGGWFFLTICESFTLGEHNFRLIGIGTYMAVAAERGDTWAIVGGTAVMIAALLLMDFLVWQPILRWAERFQRTSSDDEEDAESRVVSFFASSKRITRVMRKLRRYYSTFFYSPPRRARRKLANRALRGLLWPCAILIGLFLLWALTKGIILVLSISMASWIEIFRDALFTSLRVLGVLVFAGAIMIPFGLWLGSQPVLKRKLRAVIQVVAAFPAPMIFPVLTALFLKLGLPLDIGSIFLMMFGAQWYLLFNVIAGTSSVPREYVEVAKLAGMSKIGILRNVYLPATAPFIVTGLLTAAGGAWNVSIVAEIITFRGETYVAPGLGSYIAIAAGEQRYAELIAAVAVMVILIVLVNRFVWSRMYRALEARVQ